MGDEPPKQENDKGATPRIVPGLQALGIVTVAVIAVADLLIEDAEIPAFVYGVIPAMVAGTFAADLWKAR